MINRSAKFVKQVRAHIVLVLTHEAHQLYTDQELPIQGVRVAVEFDAVPNEINDILGFVRVYLKDMGTIVAGIARITFGHN